MPPLAKITAMIAHDHQSLSADCAAGATMALLRASARRSFGGPHAINFHIVIPLLDMRLQGSISKSNPNMVELSFLLPSEEVRHMPHHIGIAACSAEGAALCYRTICVEGAALLGPHAHPEVSMHTPSLAEYVKCLDRDDWQGVGALMLASANKLAQIGADF